MISTRFGIVNLKPNIPSAYNLTAEQAKQRREMEELNNEPSRFQRIADVRITVRKYNRNAKGLSI